MSFELSRLFVIRATAALLLLVPPLAQARALELFGICFTGDCEEESPETELIDPRRYDVEFDVIEPEGTDISDSVKTASALWQGRDDPVAGAAGLIARAKGDYRRILAALYNNGYYGGIISITVNGQQASNIKPGTDIPQTSNVRVVINTGDAYRFGETDIVNPAPRPPSKDDEVPLPEDEGFAPGEPAKAVTVRRAGKLAIQAWRQQGYPKAEVGDRSATAIHSDRQLNVAIRMAPGPYASYGDVTVEGTGRMDPFFVAYMTGLRHGVEYDPDDIEKARKRLDRLGVFSTRKIEEDQAVIDGLIPLNVVVKEKKPRRIGIGATLSTIDGAGIETFWLHRNLFGKAERLRLDAKIGGLGGQGNSLSPDQFDYFTGATFTKPGVFNPDTDLVLQAFAKREFNEVYTETSAGGSAVLTNYYSDEITLTGGVFGNYGQFEDAFGTRTFFTTGLQGEAVYDGRDDKLEPTKGFYASFKTQPFYEWEFGNAAVRFEAEGRTYLSFDDDGSSVIAARLKFGSLVGSSIAETAPSLLFLAGGGNSVRGYAYRNIGVRQANGDLTGGLSLFEGSLEFRQKITENFGVVGFVDAGTVSAAEYVDFSEDVKIGTGAGIRYYTGLGAIRLDIAVPLNPGRDDPSFGIYAGIGQSF